MARMSPSQAIRLYDRWNEKYGQVPLRVQARIRHALRRRTA